MKAQQQRIYSDVAFFTGLTPPRNYLQTASLEKSAQYIKEVFSEVGAPVEEQTWTVSGRDYKNVVATYNSAKHKRLVVGAHYDVCGDQPGADDNASAVAGLLELVRLIFENKPALDYTIEFVAYCLEEPPFFATDFMGSYIHARSLHEQRAEIMGMICLEMIGYFSDEPHSQPYPSPELTKLYPHTADYIIVVGIEPFASFNTKVHQLMAKDAAIDVQAINFPEGGGLASLSDQRNYWRFGYPALMINDTSFIRNPHYHTKGDTIETLDFGKITAVVDSAYNAVTGM